jgi:hypothetical protein
MNNRVIERAYESIRGYVPEDANQILNEQIPRIEQFIDDELTKFGVELSEYIGAEVDRLLQQSEDATARSRNEVVAVIGELRANVVAGDATLEAAVAKLERSLDDYERRFEHIGEGVRRAVISAARAAGVPIPG